MTEETHELVESMEECSIKDISVGKLIGYVNWFNKSKGFGFVKVMSDGEFKGNEIFLHFTNIMSDNYKVVFPGEYISMDICPKEEDETKFVCLNVRGVMGGLLMTDNIDNNYKVYKKDRVGPDVTNNVSQ